MRRTYPYYFWIFIVIVIIVIVNNNEESFVWFDTKGAASANY